MGVSLLSNGGGGLILARAFCPCYDRGGSDPPPTRHSPAPDDKTVRGFFFSPSAYILPRSLTGVA